MTSVGACDLNQIIMREPVNAVRVMLENQNISVSYTKRILEPWNFRIGEAFYKIFNLICSLY